MLLPARACWRAPLSRSLCPAGREQEGTGLRAEGYAAGGVPGAAAVSILALDASEWFFVCAQAHFPGPENGPAHPVFAGHLGEIGSRARTGADGARIDGLCDCVKLRCRKKFEYKCPFK